MQSSNLYKILKIFVFCYILGSSIPLFARPLSERCKILFAKTLISNADRLYGLSTLLSRIPSTGTSAFQFENGWADTVIESYAESDDDMVFLEALYEAATQQYQKFLSIAESEAVEEAIKLGARMNEDEPSMHFKNFLQVLEGRFVIVVSDVIKSSLKPVMRMVEIHEIAHILDFISQGIFTKELSIDDKVLSQLLDPKSTMTQESFAIRFEYQFVSAIPKEFRQRILQRLSERLESLDAFDPQVNRPNFRDLQWLELYNAFFNSQGLLRDTLQEGHFAEIMNLWIVQHSLSHAHLPLKQYLKKTLLFRGYL